MSADSQGTVPQRKILPGRQVIPAPRPVCKILARNVGILRKSSGWGGLLDLKACTSALCGAHERHVQRAGGPAFLMSASTFLPENSLTTPDRARACTLAARTGVTTSDKTARSLAGVSSERCSVLAGACHPVSPKRQQRPTLDSSAISRV